MVYTDALSRRSTFVEAACSGRWNTTSEQKPIELPEDDPIIFDLYLHCIYTNSVDVKDPSQTVSSEQSMLLVKIYFLADKLGDIVTSNMVLDKPISYYFEYVTLPSDFTIIRVWSNTVPNSPLRKLVVDLYVPRATVENIETLSQRIAVPHEFLYELLTEQLNIQSTDGNRRISDVYKRDFVPNNKFRYHQHNARHPRCGDQCREVSADSTNND